MQNHKQVKRFVAPTMTRALDLVRDELGPEAVILSSQRIPEGVEIITSLEPDLPTRGIDVRREFGRNFDAELDTALSSDSAWKTQASAEQIAASYGGHTEVNNVNRRGPLKGERLAKEIELARERMLAAKRQEKEEEEGPLRRPATAQTAARQEQRAGVPPRSQATSPRHEGTQHSPNYDSPRESTQGQQSHGKQAPLSPQYTSAEPAARGYGSDQNYNQSNPSYNSAAEHLNANPNPAWQGGAPEYARHESDEKLLSLQAELADMRMMMQQQLWRMSDTGAMNASVMPQQVQLPHNFSLLNQHMARLGLPDSIAQQLVSQTGKHARVSDAWRASMAILAKQLPVTGKDMVKNGGIFAFVGPTGVGKTTTIAKLAARYVLEHGPGKVALITTDTYRVGAYDQLRSLGRILNVPVRAVDGEHTLLTLIASLRNFPLILIDTAGFRHGDPLLQDQLAKLDSCQAIQRILVMSCNSQLQSLIASTHAYSSRQSISACVLSKVDETASLGEAIGVVLSKQIPVAYMTNGQEIPKDIETATGHGIVASAVAMLKTASQSPSPVAAGA